MAKERTRAFNIGGALTQAEIDAINDYARATGQQAVDMVAGVLREWMLERGIATDGVRVEVEMRAFEGGKIRTVTVPRDEWDAATLTGRLDLVYRCGQNDFQPQAICSVSEGDVILIDGQRWIVERFGFKGA